MGMEAHTARVKAENDSHVIQVDGLGEVVLEVANPADASTVAFKNNRSFRPMTLTVDGHNHRLQPGQSWRKAFNGEGMHPMETWQASFKNIHATIGIVVTNAPDGSNTAECAAMAMWLP
jgi:hypothetical protein